MVIPSRAYGALMTVISCMAMTCEVIFAKMMQEMQWPYWRITAFMCFGPLFLAFVLWARKSTFPGVANLKWIVLRSCFGPVYWGLGVVAVQVGASPGDVASLSSVNVIAAAFLGRLFLGERMHIVHWIAAFNSIAGAFLIVQPDFIFGQAGHLSDSWLGYLFAIISGFIQGCYLICSRKSADLGRWNVPPSTITSGIFCLLVAYTGLVPDYDLNVIKTSPWEALVYMLMACATTWFSVAFIFLGAAALPAAACAAVYTAAATLFGYAAQILIFHMPVNELTVAGAALMLSAVVLMAWKVESEDVDSPGLIAVVPVDSEHRGQEDTDSTHTADSGETSSLISFIASELEFSLRDDTMRKRRPLRVDQTGIQPSPPASEVSPQIIPAMAAVVCVAT
eukprot:TRINITY_DN27227_c0_g1_i1.p1 TRINITY_DN27227_c0_g1~~TRINITY_DN27227_c0_g1_i1.p1  ORF type:complete len:394 (-),score=59.95 TRINITY_DN27227_c0_g1_i1:18-1199(-)